MAAVFLYFCLIHVFSLELLTSISWYYVFTYIFCSFLSMTNLLKSSRLFLIVTFGIDICDVIYEKPTHDYLSIFQWHFFPHTFMHFTCLISKNLALYHTLIHTSICSLFLNVENNNYYFLYFYLLNWKG